MNVFKDKVLSPLSTDNQLVDTQEALEGFEGETTSEELVDVE